jgi:DNA-binding response OmpR family regulator
MNSWLVRSKRTHSAPFLSRPTKQGPRVLVVDDHHDCADGLALLLQLWGYDVRVAYGASKAVRITATWTPDLALLDLAMPQTDGFALAKFLKGMAGLERLVLMAVTGLTENKHRERAQEVGFEHYFLKPCDLSALHAAMEHAARRTAAQSGRRPNSG